MPRSDVEIGVRVFQEKFGHGEVVGPEVNRLEIEFDEAGSKKVIDRFVMLA